MNKISSPLEFPILADEQDKDSFFKNRLRKNYKHIRKFGKRTQTNCFRLYDRDIKEYPLTIDYYANHYYVQFFTSKKDIDEENTLLKEEIEQVLISLFSIDKKNIFWRTRIKRKKLEQYEKIDDQKNFFIVQEHGVQFYVNLTDYLDTGLFLDHRATRQLVASLAKGKKVLNLFSYTASFSLQAAVLGASFTKSVDLSNTYTLWAEKNFLLNGISLMNHVILREDCLKFLEKEKETYDIIVIDPPTISRSKKMEVFFDIQEEYEYLIKRALILLKKGGTLFFSTNSRKFLFDPLKFSSYRVEEITKKTIPLDFHDKKIHRCWQIQLL